jgi:hypothetical protein
MEIVGRNPLIADHAHSSMGRCRVNLHICGVLGADDEKACDLMYPSIADVNESRDRTMQGQPRMQLYRSFGCAAWYPANRLKYDD